MYEYAARVLRIIDADSIIMHIDLGFSVWVKVPIRVLGVDAPERGTKAGHAAGLFAHVLLHEVDGLIVRTQFDRSFARWLGAITLPDGTDYAQRLIEAGHGVPYRA
jgi:endonuclease YncB( thermonuclease family)